MYVTELFRCLGKGDSRCGSKSGNGVEDTLQIALVDIQELQNYSSRTRNCERKVQDEREGGMEVPLLMNSS